MQLIPYFGLFQGDCQTFIVHQKQKICFNLF